MSAGMKLAAVCRGDIVVAILVCVPCRESRAAVCRRGRGSLCPCHRLKAVWKRREDAGKSSVNHVSAVRTREAAGTATVTLTAV